MCKLPRHFANWQLQAVYKLLGQCTNSWSFHVACNIWKEENIYYVQMLLYVFHQVYCCLREIVPDDSKGERSIYQWRRQSSGEGGEIGHGRAPGRVGPFPKVKTTRFRPHYFRGPLSGLDWALLSLGWDLWCSKLAFVDTTWALQDMQMPIALNFDSERLQYLTFRIGNGTTGSERGWNFTPFSPWLRHWYMPCASIIIIVILLVIYCKINSTGWFMIAKIYP